MQNLIFLLEKALIRTIMVLLSLFSIVSSAQQVNLVRNYSFEDYSVCPGTMGDFDNYVSDWYNPDISSYGCISPDYFNTCCQNIGPHSGWAGVPNNAYGSQAGFFSSAYAGVVVYSANHPPGSYREYIEQQLYAPLLGFLDYTLKMRVNLADSSTHATYGPQMSLVSSELLYTPIDCYNTVTYSPTALYGTSFLSTYGYWYPLTNNSYQATGGEEYLIIGNVANNAGTLVQFLQQTSGIDGGDGAYYYIEDVWVSPNTIAWHDDTICEGDSIDIHAYPCDVFEYNWDASPYDMSLLGHDHDSSITVGPDETTLYTVVVEDYYGNLDTGYVTITVLNRADSVELSGSMSKCDEPGFYTIDNYVDTILYLWSTDNNQYNTIVNDTFSVYWGTNVLDSYLYIMSVDTSTGCSRIDSLLIYSCCAVGGDLVWGDTTITSPPQYGGQHPIIITGDVHFSGNITFTDCCFKLNPEKKIIIDSGSNITFLNDSLIPCGWNYMWGEVLIIDSTATLTAENTVFIGAETAVVSDNGAHVFLDSCQFIDNYIGLHIKPYALNHDLSVKSSLFKCSGTANMLDPYEDERSYAGIIIDTVGGITVGVDSFASYQNRFEYLDYGIKSLSSPLSVYNNYFVNLTQATYPFMPINGFAVYSENTTVGAKTLNVGRLTGTAYSKNLFMNCQSGVYVVDNQDVNVYKNAMANMGFTGIYFEECRYNTVNIEYDTIDGGDYGIYGRYFRRRATVNILNNYLTYQDGLGITVENDVLAGANVNIQNNYIFRPEMYGIQVTNINNNSDIDYNEVYFNLTNAGLNSEHIGILIQNSPYAHVYGNIVQNTGGTISTYPQYLKGIAVQTTTYADLCDNDVTQVGYGLYFNGYCLNSKIKRTDMTSCYVGIRLESATLGQQGSSSQPWDNRWYSNVGSYRITGTPSVVINWYYRTSANQYFVTPYSVFPIGNINPIPANPISMFSCGIIPLGLSQTTSTSAVQSLSADDQYYSDLDLLRNSDLFGLTSINTVSPDIDEIEDAVSAWEEGNIQSFVSNTSAITSDSIQAQNHRIVNNVLMRLPLIPQDSLTLYDIAVQDPLSGGEAVYTARVLLGMHLVKTLVDVTDKSVEQHNETEEWRIYPNPVNEELTIEPPFESNWLIDIYTIDGKRVFSYEDVLVSDFIQLDIAFIPSGLYRIVLTDKNGQKKYSTAFRKE